MRDFLFVTITFCVALFVCATVDAQTIATSSRSTVTGLIFYSNYDTTGGSNGPYGDVSFTLSGGTGISTPVTCNGFYIRGTDPGYKTVLTAVLTAYQAGATIVVQANTSAGFWPGNGSSYCLVNDIEY